MYVTYDDNSIIHQPVIFSLHIFWYFLLFRNKIMNLPAQFKLRPATGQNLPKTDMTR